MKKQNDSSVSSKKSPQIKKSAAGTSKEDPWLSLSSNPPQGDGQISSATGSGMRDFPRLNRVPIDSGLTRYSDEDCAA